MERDDLTATRWFTARVAVCLLAGIGFFFLAQPSFLGWTQLASLLGGESKLVAMGVGMGFLVLAAQSWERHQMRVRMAELLEAMHQLLYGKDYSRDREAIEILLKSLETGDSSSAATAHSHLLRLTGQNFAQDPKVWRSWWEANKRSFERKR